jgi:hypothetical protein
MPCRSLPRAELAVAARGSVPAVAAAADDRLRQPGAAGVVAWVSELLKRDGKMPTPRRLAIDFGSATMERRQS